MLATDPMSTAWSHAVGLSPDAWLDRVVLGEFHLRRVIGHSAYGTTYLAQQQGWHRLVTVEFGTPRLLQIHGPQRLQRRFEHEIHGRQRARHPNLATVVRAGFDERELPAVVMELAPGHPLEDELVASTLGLTAEVLTPCFAQLGAALATLHAEGVTQGDLCPRTVLFDDDLRGRPQITLLTFAMSRLRGPSQTVRDAAHRSYLAPEQREGRTVPASDIHALGAMLWWAITGTELPALSPEQLRIAHADELRAAELRATTSPLPEAVIDLVTRMLATEEHRRPTADEFVESWLAAAANLGPGLARRARPRPTSERPWTDGPQIDLDAATRDFFPVLRDPDLRARGAAPPRPNPHMG